MRRFHYMTLLAVVVISMVFPFTEKSKGGDLMRPEEIKSKRLVIYDKETYSRLAQLWKDYYDEYPSEYAYANWVYAARYAGSKDYQKLLGKAIKKYPSNPTILYLKANERHGISNDVEGLKYLEKAVAIDPNYTDPWFLLVTHYMDSRNPEKLDMALRHLLESGIVYDEVMDYNYNMLMSLDENAIIITNGDNDTYPAWILTRICNVRPDVAIVNRSLLNTEWYPIYIIENGLPRFIDESELDKLRGSILKKISEGKAKPSMGGAFGDTLILKIIDSAGRAGRPVYFSKTVYITDQIKAAADGGRDLGLAVLVTQSTTPYSDQLKATYRRWTEYFRTSGLQSWRLRNAPLTDAGRMIITNYAAGLTSNLDAIKKYAPEIRLRLFRWYIDNVEKLVPGETKSEVAREWCRYGVDVNEIATWVKGLGMECAESTGR